LPSLFCVCSYEQSELDNDNKSLQRQMTLTINNRSSTTDIRQSIGNQKQQTTADTDNQQSIHNHQHQPITNDRQLRPTIAIRIPYT
jgi:hypothetical protein